jgi:hypothetical protein
MRKSILLVVLLALALSVTATIAAGPTDGPNCRAWLASGGYAVWAAPGCMMEIFFYYSGWPGDGDDLGG